MSVKKIFMTLIVIVACVMVGAFLLNTLLPNATNELVDAAEGSIYKATGFQFDLNKNNVVGNSTTTDFSGSGTRQTTEESVGGSQNKVDGWANTGN